MRPELLRVAPVDLTRLREFFLKIFTLSPSTRIFFPSSLLLPRRGPQLGVGREEAKRGLESPASEGNPVFISSSCFFFDKRRNPLLSLTFSLAAAALPKKSNNGKTNDTGMEIMRTSLWRVAVVVAAAALATALLCLSSPVRAEFASNKSMGEQQKELWRKIQKLHDTKVQAIAAAANVTRALASAGNVTLHRKIVRVLWGVVGVGGTVGESVPLVLVEENFLNRDLPRHLSPVFSPRTISRPSTITQSALPWRSARPTALPWRSARPTALPWRSARRSRCCRSK